VAVNSRSVSELVAALEALDAATTRAAVLHGLSDVLSPLGLSHLLITGLPQPEDGPWHREILYDGWPSEWLERYNSLGHFSHDPCARCSRHAHHPFLWSDLPREQMSKQQLLVMDEAKEFGLMDGMCVPIHLPLGAPAVVTAAGDRIEVVREELPILEMMCVQAFRAIRRLREGNSKTPKGKLTAREREVLTWIALGKSAEDIACILAISRHTVERHLKNIREKLFATNTVHAVMEAVRRREIRI
jgi:LuxR family quorum sensing-dependent transcriptional regulator